MQYRLHINNINIEEKTKHREGVELYSISQTAQSPLGYRGAHRNQAPRHISTPMRRDVRRSQHAKEVVTALRHPESG